MPYNYGNYYGNYNNMNGMNQYSQAQMPVQNYQQPTNVSYAPNYGQIQPQMNYSQGNSATGINWVQGRAGANSFYVAPGQSALLMDSEDSVLYVKSVDMTGRPLPLEVYELVKRDSVIDAPQISQKAQYNQSGNNVPNVMSSGASEPHVDLSEYVKKSDVEKMIADAVNKALAE